MGKTVNSDGKIYTETLGKIRKFGLSVYATFVFGYDSDTFNSFRQTLKFSIRNNFFFMAFNHLVPFPGTPLYDRLKSENRLIYDAWWLSETYRFGEFTFHPKNFSAGEVTELCLRYRKKFYSWSSILKRGLDFRSNCKSLWTAFIYFQQNFSSRKDVDRRQGLPLGLIGDLDPIIRKEV